MAFQIYPNEPIYGISWWFYRLKEILLTKGWTVPASSDGVTYGSSSDVITGGNRFGSSTVTPGSTAAANAWMRLRHPLGSCELLFHHSTGNAADAWKLRYSKLGFVGGSPSATVPPTATDEVYIFGSSTTFQAVEGTLDSNSVFMTQFVVGDADEDYAFFSLAAGAGGGVSSNLVLLFDRVTDMEVDTDDPTIFALSGTNTLDAAFQGSATLTTPQTTSVRCWGFMSKFQTTVETQMVAWSPGFSTMNGLTAGTQLLGQSNPWNGKNDVYVERLSWFRTPVITLPVNVVHPLRSNRKGKSRILRGAVGEPMGRRVFTVGGQTYLVFPSSQTNALANRHFWLVPWQAGILPRW